MTDLRVIGTPGQRGEQILISWTSWHQTADDRTGDWQVAETPRRPVRPTGRDHRPEIAPATLGEGTSIASELYDVQRLVCSKSPAEPWLRVCSTE